MSVSRKPLPTPSPGLPLKRDLTLDAGLSILIALLLAAASIAGLLDRAGFYPSPELLTDLGALDVVNLALGLPALLLSLWLARRGSLAGLLCWPGAVFFVLYTNLIFLFALPYGLPLVLHLALVALSLYALLGLLAAIDGPAVQRALDGAVPVRLAGASLAGQGLLNFLFVAGALLYPLAIGARPAAPGLANNLTDVFVTPAWMICGVLLWRRQPFGYVAALGLLLQGSLFILSIGVLALLQTGLGAGLPVVARLGMILVGGSLCFVPFALYARGVLSHRAAAPLSMPGS